MLCGYLVEKENLPLLRKLGVKDSKLLTADKRKKMFSELKKIAAGTKIIQVPAHEIDSSNNLNKLEIRKMQEIINFLKPDRVYIDAPERNVKRFSEKIAKGLEKKTEIISENYADRKYLQVGAASIIAKIARDAEIVKLHKIYGNFGSGYTSDERTIAFLKDWIKENKEFPPEVRKSWITVGELIREKQQKKLSAFG